MAGYSPLARSCGEADDEEALPCSGASAGDASGGAGTYLSELAAPSASDEIEVTPQLLPVESRSISKHVGCFSNSRRITGVATSMLLVIAVAWSCNFTPSDILAIGSGPKGTWRPYDVGSVPFTVNVIYVPELASDQERLRSLQAEYDLYVAGGKGMLHPTVGVDPDFWPSSGRYYEYRSAVEQMFSKEPWWTAIAYEEPKVSAAHGYGHHVGCLGSHMMTWWEANTQNAQGLLIAEVDGGPLRFASGTGGCAGDLLAVAKAAFEQAPEGWHIIHLDQGPACAEKNVVKVLKVPGTDVVYDLRAWFGGGCAGTGLMLVSGRWIEEFPPIVEKYKPGLKVDAWFGSLCSIHVINCYSAQAQVPQRTCPDHDADM